MVFYTDTNGIIPTHRSTALIMLGMAMECERLDEIPFENFAAIEREITDMLEEGE